MEKKSKEEKLQEKLEKREEKLRLKEEKRRLKEEKKANKNIDENKVTFKEKVSVNVRKKWLIDGTRTFLLIVILILAYISLNLAMTNLDLPEFDVSESKVYTLSEASKKAIEKVNQDVKIYAYGFEEDSQLIKFLKKYNAVNEKITYEVLTEESNYDKVKENDLKEGYYVLIIESGESKKVIDASTEFSTVDYTTSQQLDTTEQSITNAILGLMVENKPKVYFTEGHSEYSLSQDLTLLDSYLQNESFETASINLATTTDIPADCSVLAIMSPTTDFFENERDMVLRYIENGGKIYCSIEPMQMGVELPNVAAILSVFGVSVQNGQIIELTEERAVATSPNVFNPQVSSAHPITSDIYSSNGRVWIAYSSRLQFKSDEELTSLGVERENLLTSTEESIFVTDLSQSLEAALQTAEKGSSVVASILSKSVTKTNEEGENINDTAKLLLSASGSYITNYLVEDLSKTVPLAYAENNKDFAINSIANLADKEGLTIRKEITSSTYVPTESQITIVSTIIFGTPLVIIAVGFIIWGYRKKRK